MGIEKRELKVLFSKGGAGNISPKINLPMKWIREMGMDIDNRNVEVRFNGEEIVIKKI